MVVTVKLKPEKVFGGKLEKTGPEINLTLRDYETVFLKERLLSSFSCKKSL